MRRPVLISLLLLMILVAGGLLTVYILLRHEPDFYRLAAVPPGSQRQQDSRAFETQAFDLYTGINNAIEWEARFTEQQVNSYLAEDFIRSNLAAQFPPEITEPRVVFRQATILLAFRYGDSSWQSIVSIEAKVWVSKQEPNVVALQFEELRAGALPLAVKVLQDHLEDCFRRQNIQLQWYRHEGKPVALLRFQADKREPSIQLLELDIGEGTIYFKGRSVDPDVRRMVEYSLEPSR